MTISSEPMASRAVPSAAMSLPGGSGVRAALDSIAEATRGLSVADGSVAAQVKAARGRLLGVGQVRDSFDQRMEHVASAAARAGDVDAATRAALWRVISAQLAAAVDLLERAAAEAGREFAAVETLGRSVEGPAAQELAAAGEAGGRAARALSAAAEELAVETADLEPAGLDFALQGPVDLGWMEALYTMDEERRVHRLALAAG